jgi:hypothetical protein
MLGDAVVEEKGGLSLGVGLMAFVVVVLGVVSHAVCES